MEKVLKMILNSNTQKEYLRLASENRVSSEKAKDCLNKLIPLADKLGYDMINVINSINEVCELIDEQYQDPKQEPEVKESEDEKLSLIFVNKDIMLNHELSMQEKVILGFIDGFETAFFGNEFLAEKFHLSKKRIEQIIHNLKEKGYLKASYTRNQHKQIVKRTLTVDIPRTNETFLSNGKFTGLFIDSEYLDKMDIRHAFIFSIIILLDNGEGCCLSAKEWKQLTNLTGRSISRIVNELEKNDYINVDKNEGLPSVCYVKDRSILNFKVDKNEGTSKVRVKVDKNEDEGSQKLGRYYYNYLNNYYYKQKEKNTNQNNTQAQKQTTQKQNKKQNNQDAHIYSDINTYPEDVIPTHF